MKDAVLTPQGQPQRVGWHPPTIFESAMPTLERRRSPRRCRMGIGSSSLNGLERRDSSRALELDLSASAARTGWQWQPRRRNLSAFVGSARRLANGHTLITFGMSAGGGSTGPIEVYEVNQRGRHRMASGNRGDQADISRRAVALDRIGVHERRAIKLVLLI